MTASRIVAVLSMALLFGCPWAVAGSVLENGGFEERIEPWEYEGEWLSDPEQARTGSGCITGSVDQPDRALVLKQTVRLRADAIYELRAWARATDRSKMVLWLRRNDERRQLADLLRVGRKWEPLSRQFSVDETGDYDLEFSIPSSYRASPGRMWLDDVTLVETQALPSKTLTAPGVHDHPAMAVDARGNVYLGWIENRQGADRLRLAVGRVDDGVFTKASEFDYDVGSTAIGSVVLGGQARGAWGCASVEGDSGFDIRCFRVGARGPRDGGWVRRDDATDIHPSLAVNGRSAWVVWESNRGGSRQIWARSLPLRSDRPAVRLSGGESSNYFPAAAANDDGDVVVVWTRAVDGQYDLQTNRLSDGRWTGVRPLTSNPYLELRPDVLWAGDGFWVAWEVSEHPSLRTGYASQRRVMVARIGESGLEAPPDGWDAIREWSSAPRLAALPDGGIALTVRTSQWRRGNWSAWLYTLDADGWRDLGPATVETGRNRPSPLVAVAGRLLVATQVDHLDVRWQSARESTEADSEIVAALSGPLPSGPKPAQQMTLAPLSLPTTEFDAKAQREALGEESPRQVIRYQDQELKLYWGQFHEHSEVSFDSRRVDLPPDENYMVNRDYHRMDFAALTDHGFNMSPHIWAYTAKVARWQHDPGRFVTFLAQEWTSSVDVVTSAHPHGYYGHRNLILADPHYPRWFNAREQMTPLEVWDTLREDDADFIHIPHQTADTGNVPVDWDFVDEQAQPLAEIFQLRGSYEHHGAPREAANTVDGYFLQDAWNDGVIIGVIASPDHGGGPGKAAVYAPELTREAILEACRNRHTYGTTGPRIALDFRVNDALMGSKLALASGPVRLAVRVSSPEPLTLVEFLRNGEVIHARAVTGHSADVDVADRRVPRDGDYYYVRIRAGDELAWASPVWFLEDPNGIQRREGFREPVDP